MKTIPALFAVLLLVPVAALCADTSQALERDDDSETLRVFIFAGQSNRVGSDSKVKDIKRFPPFTGLDKPQDQVLLSSNIGREEKRTSNGWVALQPVENVVGPELSFGKEVLTTRRFMNIRRDFLKHVAGSALLAANACDCR